MFVAHEYARGNCDDGGDERDGDNNESGEAGRAHADALLRGVHDWAHVQWLERALAVRQPSGQVVLCLEVVFK